MRDADNIKTETEINRKHKNSICYLHLLFQCFPKQGKYKQGTNDSDRMEVDMVFLLYMLELLVSEDA